jgi:hypothetical protein
VSQALRCEGPLRLTQKRSSTLVSASPAAAEIANIRHPRDFQSPSIFDFFNSLRKADVRQSSRQLKASAKTRGNPRFSCLGCGNSDVYQPVTPLCPGFGLPVMYKAANWRPADDTVATREALKAATLQQRGEMIGMDRNHHVEP